jgi:CheY-like chemotaxis protein
MQGVDILSKELKRVQTRLPREISESKELRAFFEETKGQFKSMRNTNVFMMMTINRVIDFAKATKGLNLLPKLDTIDLMETLNLPLNCMKNIQDRVNIKLMPIDSSTIHNFLITDKQWLQENILCLLSNAVKYSNGGEVSIRVTRQRSSGFVTDIKPLSGRSSFLASFQSDLDVGHCQTMECTEPQNLSSGSRRLFYSRLHFSLFSTSTAEGSTPSPSTITNIVRSFRNALGSDISKPEFLLFEVEDTGIGMSEEVMQSLFSPFKQAQRLAGGTGLGLYSLSKRIEALNGQYGVRKRKDGKEGSLFWFTIPYRPDFSIEADREINEAKIFPDTKLDDLEDCITTSVKQIPTSPKLNFVHSMSMPIIKKSFLYSAKTVDANNRAIHILLVEDSPTIAKMTSLMLERLGYQVTHASNGYVGLQLMTSSFEINKQHVLNSFQKIQEEDIVDISNNDSTPSTLNLFSNSYDTEDTTSTTENQTIFDLVLMDFQMPIMDGFESTKRYREIEKQGNISIKQDILASLSLPISVPDYHLPIIGLTAASDDETIQHGLDAGLDDYLLKPLSEQSLNSKIQKYFLLVQKATAPSHLQYNSK